MPKKQAGRTPGAQAAAPNGDHAVAGPASAAKPQANGSARETTASRRSMIHLGIMIWLFYKIWAMQQVSLKTEVEVGKIRKAGQVAAELLAHLTPMVRSNVSTAALDEATVAFCVSRGIDAAPLNYGGLLPAYLSPSPEICSLWGRTFFGFMHFVGMFWETAKGIAIPLCGFPRSICISVNDVVCHGIPGAQVLQPGDLVNLDVTVVVDGYHGDSSVLVLVDGPALDQRHYRSSESDQLHGQDTAAAKLWPEQWRLGRVARECLFAGLLQVRAGATIGDIGAAVTDHAHQAGFSVVTAYGGHGIGAKFHEPPHVPHVGKRGMGQQLKAGMIFTVEPMVNAGRDAVVAEADQWTIRTADGSLSAQWEHMVLVREDGCEILTWRPGETSPEGFLLHRTPHSDVAE